MPQDKTKHLKMIQTQQLIKVDDATTKFKNTILYWCGPAKDFTFITDDITKVTCMNCLKNFQDAEGES
jgi:hypothetical protein